MVKISVIVPVYGVEKYIKKCIDSLVNQTFKDIEIMVIDDETKDRSIEIINENFKDKRIKIFHKKNGGLASARNYGVERSNGEYLFFVDSDDFLDINCLKEMYDKIKDDNADIVICDYYKLLENGVKTHEHMIPHYDMNNSKISVISMPSACGKLIKKSIFIDNNIKFLEKHYFEDNAIMPFVCALSKKTSYIEKPFYFYLQRNGSILNKENIYDKKWEDIFDSVDNLYNKFIEKNILDDYYSEVEYIYIEYLLHGPSLRFMKYEEGIPNIKKISNIMKSRFPNWQKNKYYRKENIKYRIICTLFYYNQLFIAKLLLRK